MFCFLTNSDFEFFPNKNKNNAHKNEWMMKRKGNIAKGKVCQLENAKKNQSKVSIWLKLYFSFNKIFR